MLKRISAAAFAVLAVFAWSAPRGRLGPLVSTQWKQRDAYAAFTPLNPETGEHERLGCWSVAFAQILFLHKLEPRGSQAYSGEYYAVKADFDAPDVDLSLVAPRLEAGTPGARKLETARYLWYAALATGKDFGTGGYLGNSDLRRERIETHYGVGTRRLRTLDSSKAEIEAFIRSELESGRPLLLYVEGSQAGEEGSGHALVIDGIEGSGESLSLHLNFGWEGVSDGWYAFWKPIVSAYGTFDSPDRWVLAIRP
ncbi:MAG: C10 family peptidase [Spirochaetes bacterium]|nr:C10 family peptidase [Spirochaetota bacterium]